MTNSYDVDHGLSQDSPGPLGLEAPDDTPARTGNTARDQEMYAAGLRDGEENAKHNAAIRAGLPDGWKLLAKKTCYMLMHDGAVIATLAGPDSKENAAIIASLLAAPASPVSTVEQGDEKPWPAGLLERVKAAGQRIRDGHGSMRIPADPTDPDLVLAEVAALIEGRKPPFWLRPAPAAGDARLPDINVEAAAKALAECMDYPWAHMPEQGRAHMREHAQSVIRAGLPAAQRQGDA